MDRVGRSLHDSFWEREEAGGETDDAIICYPRRVGGSGGTVEGRWSMFFAGLPRLANLRFVEGLIRMNDVGFDRSDLFCVGRLCSSGL